MVTLGFLPGRSPPVMTRETKVSVACFRISAHLHKRPHGPVTLSPQYLELKNFTVLCFSYDN